MSSLLPYSIGHALCWTCLKEERFLVNSHVKHRSPGPLTRVDARFGSKIDLDPRLTVWGLSEDRPFLAVIEVSHPGYVPEGVALRKTITPSTITAQVRPSTLKSLEDDPGVVMVSSGQPIRR
jgi:hypothetical protein